MRCEVRIIKKKNHINSITYLYVSCILTYNNMYVYFCYVTRKRSKAPRSIFACTIMSHFAQSLATMNKSIKKSKPTLACQFCSKIR
ncbi:hypothetical protein BpHYR1_014104 [Brachionus plicatilis]|uniref:Uncharacterized protein n=1 Tax=Brachionus plicatilis TaxID=10195 RepID=A0A3M7P970_BRAPC|nr:hypothetical protein BpHYR1_014104 [Brachionus plicatilis]